MDRKEKLRQAGIAKHGSEEAWREAMREYGARADRTTPRGFAILKDKDRKLHSEISKRGAEARWAKQRAEETDSEENDPEDGHFTKKDLI